MKILLVDAVRSRRAQLTDALQKKRYEVTACISSNDFVTTVEKQKFDYLLLDMDAWIRGKSLYNYFGLSKKLENLPIVFYNSSMNFSILNDRPRHSKDRILFKPSEVDAILGSVQDTR